MLCHGIGKSKQEKPDAGGFLKFTPELQASYLLDPMIQHWIEFAPKMNWENNRIWKSLFAKRLWPEMPLRGKVDRL